MVLLSVGCLFLILFKTEEKEPTAAAAEAKYFFPLTLIRPLEGVRTKKSTQLTQKDFDNLHFIIQGLAGSQTCVPNTRTHSICLLNNLA